MKWRMLVLCGSVMLSAACVPRKTILLDPSVPHAVAEASKVVVWCADPQGGLVKCAARLDEGWWVASPLVVDAPAR